ncbi:MAG: tol-pal system protein YbgF [Legionellales bacterium]|nr:tol-pal system protein YbgF [Legionellales bacterium]
MKVIVHTVFATLIGLSVPVLAAAPVVDDSENFAILEEQAQAAEELPIAREEDAILDDLDGSVSQHTSKHSEARAGNTDFVNKMQSLQKEIQELRGQLEVQSHELDELKQQQLDLTQDIDNRNTHPNLPVNNNIATNQPTIAPALPANAKKSGPPQFEVDIQPMQNLEQATSNVRINPADEQISYLAAYDLVKQKHFPQATQAMQQFLSKYPHGGYSANAHYWLGELFLANKDYANAVTHFDTVIQNFKTSSKFAPSRLKLGYTLAESGRIAEAKEQLLAVVNQYPDTTTARLAHIKLEKLGG